MYGEKAAKHMWNNMYPKYKNEVHIEPGNDIATITKNTKLMVYCELRRKRFLEFFGWF